MECERSWATYPLRPIIFQVLADLPIATPYVHRRNSFVQSLQRHGLRLIYLALPKNLAVLYVSDIVALFIRST